ncbi:MAG: TonB family protein [Prevotella pallens]|nr:TonB family protein [Prevotella pallens]
MTMYFLKLNIALIVLFGFYKLMFSGDTFFSLRRATLIGIYIVAMLVPELNCLEWINKNVEITSIANQYATFILPTVTITPNKINATNWETIALTIYNMVVCVLLVRFFCQLISIIKLRNKCRTANINGVKVYLLENNEGPFSFFNWIFISPSKHNTQQTHEIIKHELTHCKQWHSVDILFTELFSTIFWINPFVWLLKREIRLNLEYLADNNVLTSGANKKEYQYHLLVLTYQKNVATISNNFNVLPLKKRIEMMNKERTKQIAKAKYALYIPLIATLLIVSNIETVARNIANVAKTIGNKNVEQKKIANLASGKKVIKRQKNQKRVQHTGQTACTNKKTEIQTTNNREEMVAKKVENTAEIATNNPTQEQTKRTPKKIYDVIDNMPTFNGNINQWLALNLNYPIEAVEKKQQGKVILEFVVSEYGEILEPKVIRSVSPILDKEAIRTILAMPKWNPGKLNGKPVAVRYMLPITFKLN